MITPLSNASPLDDALDVETTSRRYEADLARGSWLSALGFLGKLLQPLVFLVVTWAFGASTTGVFLLVTFLGEMFRGAIVDGYADAVTVVASWGLGHDLSDGAGGRQRFRDTTAAAIRTTTAISLLVVPAAYIAAPILGRTLFAAHAGFADALFVTSLGMPFVAFATIALAATRALFQIHYQVALINFGRPLATLLAAGVAATTHSGLTGLLIGVLIADIVIAVAAGAALAHEIGGRAMTRALLSLRTPPRLHELAIPQSANLTLNRYLTRIDALMLGAMGMSSADVAFYGTGALITSSLREAKLVFTGALAPVVSRHHASGELDAISALIGRISRWTGTIIMPLVVAILVLRNDLVRSVDSHFVGNTAFVLALLVPQYLVGSTGLAGNCVFYTGHSRWNLANSVAVAGLNTMANLVLIPRYGLLGAAIATAFASAVVALAELVELRALERITIPWRDIRSVQFGLVAALVPLVFIGDPAAIATLPLRASSALGMIAIFFGVATWTGHPELRARLRRKRA